MAASYKEELEGNGIVELVHISRDDSESSMEGFYGLADPSFPAVKFSRLDSLKIATKLYEGGVPQYVLVDGDGKKLADGWNASLAKAKQLIRPAAP